MNLLFIQETNWFNRGPHQQHHLAERLALRGHRIRVIDYEFDWQNNPSGGLYSPRQVFNDASRMDRNAQIELIRPAMLKIPFLTYLSLLQNHRREIEHQIKNFTPDAIISFGILNAFLAASLSRVYRIPFIYYWIDVLHRLIPFKIFQPIGKFLERETLKKSTNIVVINQRLKEYIAGLGAPLEAIRVIPAGIDLKRYNPSTTDDRIRQHYNLSSEDLVLFFMGWIYKFSGLKEVALELARSEYHHIKLLVVGDGDAYEELSMIQQQYNLGERMILTGKRPYNEMPEFIAASDVCLLPAYPEEKIMQDIVPIKIYEYMAMAKPVISTHLPGVLAEFGQNNGIIYVNKPADVIKKAIEMRGNNQLYSTGLKARKFVEKQSWETITEEFQELIEEAIKESNYANGQIKQRLPQKL
jgi:glycosyltransferase involved in cell wall biosynthesis